MPSRTTQTITLSGPDAPGFANGQFSSDVLSLAVGRWQWSAWLDPKGRVRAFLQVARPDEDRLVAILRGGDATSLAADLRRFVFRSKVKIAVSDMLVVSDGDVVDDGDAHEETDGTLVLGEGDASIRIGAHGDNDAWLQRHIKKGYAWLPDAAIDALLPPALSMERLTAVAFDKGCFPGQEIAARLHFLGGHKKHLRIVVTTHPLRDGHSLRIDGRDAGIVLIGGVFSNTPTSLVVLDDAVVQGDTLDIEGDRMHIISTFDA